MSNKVILITLRQIHANEIFAGSSVKSYEYRKNPPNTSFPVRAIMYVSRETDDNKSKPVREIVGVFLLGAVDGSKTKVGFPMPITKVIILKTG